MNIQDVANQLSNHSMERRNNRDCEYDRVLHNASLQDLIRDLSIDCDLE